MASKDKDHLAKMKGAQGGQSGAAETVKCNQPGCDYEGTPENLNRHFRMKHGDEFVPEGTGENAPAPAAAKQIFYISRRPMKRKVRASQSITTVSPMGQPVKTQTTAPIFLSFDLLASGKGMFVLNEATARAKGLTFDELKTLIENDSDFKDKNIWVGGSDEEYAKKGPKMTGGTRSSAK